MAEELKAQIVWQDDKDFGKVCTLTESAFDGIINETTKELQEENKQLKKKLVQTQDAVTMQMYTNKANKEQFEKQIEKMKCCYNCSKWNDGECKDCPSPIYTMADFNCDKWELAE